MRQITTTSGTRVTIGSNAVPSALTEGPETTTNFLLALDDALAAGHGCWFVANGTHYSLNRLNEVNREPSGPMRAPQWNPKGTAVTWAEAGRDETEHGTGTATGLYTMSGPFNSGPAYYGVINDADGETYWVMNPARRH